MNTKVLFAKSVVIISCNAQHKITGNHACKTEYPEMEMDSSQTCNAWGNDRNRFHDIAQAKKNAENDVLFNGIYEGKQDGEKLPVDAEVNARQKYETYFNKFFADDVEYKKYVSLKDERIDQKIFRDRKGARQSVPHGVGVCVFRAELKQKIIEDGILKN